jgi:hypothetical protein
MRVLNFCSKCCLHDCCVNLSGRSSTSAIPCMVLKFFYYGIICSFINLHKMKNDSGTCRKYFGKLAATDKSF